MSDRSDDVDRSEPGVLRLRPEAVTWRSVEGEIVALDVDESEYLATNESGGALWEALADGTTEAELVALLVQRWEIDEDQAGQDVRAFLSELEQRDFLE